MKIHLISVGKNLPDWIESGYQEYSKRLPREFSLNLIEISPVKRQSNISVPQIKAREASAILKQIPDNGFVIVLDEHGKLFSTTVLAEQLNKWQQQYQAIYLVIGGADGLSPEMLNRANGLWSLSPLTLPHGLARILVAEQIYRAYSILINHPYHRA